MKRTLALELFKEMLARPERDIDLAAMALLIAWDEYPNLDVQSYLERLDRLADRVARQLPPPAEGSVVATLDCMNRILFGQEGFQGNTDAYYDPRNSFLNEVLDRRTGIPLTLSVIYMEIGRRLGLDIRGVGMPGHFIVKCLKQDAAWLLDPFYGGKILTEEDCRKRLTRLHGKEFTFRPSFLDCVDKRLILCRLLTNLKMVYLGQRDFRRALAAIERILLISPQSACEIRDRGSVSFQLNRHSAAIQDWKRYLAMEPEAPDAQEVKENLRIIAGQLGLRN